MSETVIRVENLSKKYILHHQQQESYKTLRDLLANGAMSVSRRLLNRSQRKFSELNLEAFLALQDLSFEIQQGDRVGIIGRNGAGKSTLLKILSRITDPTTGKISIKGRVASLLEVGTGFHPELTGRENIYLNGAVLGMSRAEITRKFDDIVAFSEVEKFLDTPVKRYSSGMYVRLAFAVAAYLETEILIVDEVLAVGDIQFQKKCLGKMQDISKSEGRTVLFVSHNMDAIQRLCSRCIVLERGQLMIDSDTNNAIKRYLVNSASHSSPNQWIDVSNASHKGSRKARFVAVQYTSFNEDVAFYPYPNGPLEVSLAIESDAAMTVASLAVAIYSQAGTILVNADTVTLGQMINLQQGHNEITLIIEQLHLKPDIYLLGLWLEKSGSGNDVLDFVESAFEIEVVELVSKGLGRSIAGSVTCQFKILQKAHKLTLLQSQEIF